LRALLLKNVADELIVDLQDGSKKSFFRLSAPGKSFYSMCMLSN
jgi:hypothetical protein